MKNVFILYMPPGNPEAMVHYEDTIRKRVEPQRIFRFTDTTTTRKLQTVFGNRRIPVWGQEDKSRTRMLFEKMREGDDVLIVEGSTIRLLGHVACKTVNPDLSNELWKSLRGDSQKNWGLIYFIANAREIDLPFSECCRLFGYRENYQLRGFTTIAEDKVREFYTRYDDLYSVLLRIKEGRPVEELARREALPSQQAESSASPPDAGDYLPEAMISDHIMMQWKLLNLGVQAGERVWIPRSDQGKITASFKFEDFEETFAAGLDTQTKYIENIDVVWKEEFKIDAAFEVENSTSIYSGLLRFADLTMVAPNSLYPLFIVAPRDRRNAVAEQLRRPSFKHLKISERVRYLSYDSVHEIEEFFGEKGQGVSTEVLLGKSEQLVRGAA